MQSILTRRLWGGMMIAGLCWLGAGCGPEPASTALPTANTPAPTPAAGRDWVVQNGVVLPQFDLATLPDEAFSPDGWSAPTEEGEVKCRMAKAGGPRSFQVNAWWAEQDLRPPEGTVYIFEVQYKDTVKEPATFYSMGASGLYFGMTPMHTFGGTNDGQWKTASIPISWDLVIRLKNLPARAQFGVSAEADLPVGPIRVRLATAEDAARYQAETRDWVAHRQTAVAATRPILAPTDQPAAGTAPQVFPWPALAPLLPNARPKPAQVGAPIRIRMCKGEMEGGSFGVYAGSTGLKAVRYTVGELKTADGEALDAEIIPRTAEYALIGGKSKARWFPQRLWPVFPADIPAGRSQWYLFNIRTSRAKTAPGVYRGRVKIEGDGFSSSLPVEVEVLDIDLLTMDEAGLTMGACCIGLPPMQDVQFQAEYNNNCMDLWYFSANPAMTRKNGKLELDWYYFDDWMTRAKKHGLQSVVWFLGGDPYGYPDTAHLIRELSRIDAEDSMAARKAWLLKQSQTPDRLLPETRPLMVEWAQVLFQHSTTHGWPEIIVTPFDEPAKWTQTQRQADLKDKLPGTIGTGKWIKGIFKDCCAAIHEGAPKMRIYGSIHHNRQTGDTQNEGIVFLPDIEVFCTNAIHEDPQLGDKVRAGGPTKSFWQYSGGGGGGGGAPDVGRFNFGFFFAAFDSRGSLSWAYNWGPGFDTGSSDADASQYGWATPFGTVPSPFMEGVREAWDDRRIIETYKKKFANDAERMGVLTKILDEAAKSRTAGGRDTVNDFWAAIDDVAKLDAWRNTLLDALAGAK